MQDEEIIRRALGLTQEEEPDQAARAYLRAIAGDPAGVQRALHAPIRQPG